MKVSIVIAILNSHEVVRRQILYFEKMPLPEGVEVVFVDDGSQPPLEFSADFLSIHKVDIPGRWTQPAARNYGSRQAKGEFCIFTDIDHIISREVIEEALNPRADVIRFKREVGILDENGNFTQDMSVMREYGFIRDSLKIAPHGNSYIMRTALYVGVGGVDERYVGTGKYPNREEVLLKKKLKALEKKDEIIVLQDKTKPTIYMFPNGRYCGDKDYNPFNLFHNLSRERNIGRKTNKQKRMERRGL